MRRFLVAGLPRSGTTYVVRAIASHPDARCHGEVFAPYRIERADGAITDPAALAARDGDPAGFLTELWDEMGDAAAGGAKYILGHDVAILDLLERDPAIHVIHVTRPNRLAQAGSLLRALASGEWQRIVAPGLEDAAPAGPPGQVHAPPSRIAQHWHPLAAFDRLFAHWLAGLPNPALTLPYPGIARPETHDALCGFLSLARRPLRADTAKQAPGPVRDRFARANEIAPILRARGLEHWLDEE